MEGERPGKAESGLGAHQSMQTPAAGSLSARQKPLEIRDRSSVSLRDELSCTDVRETQAVLWPVYPDMNGQRHLQGQLQDEGCAARDHY